MTKKTEHRGMEEEVQNCRLRWHVSYISRKQNWVILSSWQNSFASNTWLFLCGALWNIFVSICQF